jgi:hypothetical protein
MNSTKITTFKPSTQNPMTKIIKPSTQNPMTKIIKPSTQNPMTKINKPISQVTNDPDIDEYTTDIW